MLKLVTVLKQFIKQPPVSIDGTVFRIHVMFTTMILLACSLFVTATQLVGNPMQCIVHGLPEKPVNTYCWITSTYTMPDSFNREYGKTAIHPGVGLDTDEPPKYYTYYQWVCFALFLQGMLCYLPKWIWERYEGGLMSTLVMGMQNGLGDPRDTEKQIKILVHYMKTHMGRHNSYVIKYWLCEFLCLVNIVMQIYWMNCFFDGEFINYGFRVLRLSEQHQDLRDDPMVYIFPRVTKCTFRKFGPSGTLQTHDSLCILPLNILNEKTYIVIWFWYMLLLIALIFMAAHRIVLIFNPKVRKTHLRYRHYKFITDDIAEALMKKSSIGDWWIFYMLSKNMEPSIFRDAVWEIAKPDESRFEV